MTKTMRSLLLIGMAVSCLALPGPALADPKSAAARWIVDEQIREACGPDGGYMDAGGFFEGDLTGNGGSDFILSHSGIRCSGGGMSAFCGAQACSLLIYVRRGELLALETELLSIGFQIEHTPTQPTIHVTGHGGQRSTLRWDRGTFR